MSPTALPLLRTPGLQDGQVEGQANGDTHGPLLASDVQNALRIPVNKDIEANSLEDFNQRCRESVFEETPGATAAMALSEPGSAVAIAEAVEVSDSTLEERTSATADAAASSAPAISQPDQGQPSWQSKLGIRLGLGVVLASTAAGALCGGASRALL